MSNIETVRPPEGTGPYILTVRMMNQGAARLATPDRYQQDITHQINLHAFEQTPGRFCYLIALICDQPNRTSWKTFLKAHWDVMTATVFFTVEAWTPRGLMTYYLLFIMHISTRSIHIAGVAMAPNGALIKHIAHSNGFIQLGQFSRDYTHLFGELPSETLQRG